MLSKIKKKIYTDNSSENKETNKNIYYLEFHHQSTLNFYQIRMNIIFVFEYTNISMIIVWISRTMYPFDDERLDLCMDLSWCFIVHLTFGFEF